MHHERDIHCGSKMSASHKKVQPLILQVLRVSLFLEADPASYAACCECSFFPGTAECLTMRQGTRQQHSHHPDRRLPPRTTTRLGWGTMFPGPKTCDPPRRRAHRRTSSALSASALSSASCTSAACPLPPPSPRVSSTNRRRRASSALCACRLRIRALCGSAQVLVQEGGKSAAGRAATALGAPSRPSSPAAP